MTMQARFLGPRRATALAEPLGCLLRSTPIACRTVKSLRPSTAKRRVEGLVPLSGQLAVE